LVSPLLADLLAATGHLLQLGGGGQLGLRAPAVRCLAGLGGQPPGLARRAGDLCPRLGVELDHLGLGLAGAPRKRARDRPHRLADRARSVAHLRGGALDDPGQLGSLAHQGLGALQGEHRIRRVADIGLDHRRIDPHRPSVKARLALGLGDYQPGDLVDRLGPQPPRQLSDRRLVGHAPVDRDQTEPPQMQRVRDLPHQRLVAPPRPLLDHHQPHIGVHRDRRAPMPRRRAPRHLGLGLPVRRDRRQQVRIAQQRVDPREILGSSRTPTASTSSHNDSTCPAAKRNTRTSQIAHKHTHLQVNHPCRPGQNHRQRGRLFPGEVASAPPIDVT